MVPHPQRPWGLGTQRQCERRGCRDPASSRPVLASRGADLMLPSVRTGELRPVQGLPPEECQSWASSQVFPRRRPLVSRRSTLPELIEDPPGCPDPGVRPWRLSGCAELCWLVAGLRAAIGARALTLSRVLRSPGRGDSPRVCPAAWRTSLHHEAVPPGGRGDLPRTASCDRGCWDRFPRARPSKPRFGLGLDLGECGAVGSKGLACVGTACVAELLPGVTTCSRKAERPVALADLFTLRK